MCCGIAGSTHERSTIIIAHKIRNQSKIEDNFKIKMLIKENRHLMLEGNG